jgi:hypothetical protein
VNLVKIICTNSEIDVSTFSGHFPRADIKSGRERSIMMRLGLLNKTNRSKALLGGCMTALLLMSGIGCSEANGVAPVEEQASPETGTLELPLVIEVGDNVYRLSMTLEVYGDFAWDSIYTDAFSEETSIQRALPTGDYNAYLSYWQLYKEDGGEIFPVASTLVSSNYSYFTIHNNATSTLSYTFETDGVRVVVGTGNLVVNVEVNEVAPACEPLGDTCGEGYWCPPTELTGKSLSCNWVEGSGAVGDPCGSPRECGANLSCFDFGAGPVCGALCLATDFEDECATGGTCVPQGQDYGVCVPEGGTPPEVSGGFGGGFGGEVDGGTSTSTSPVPSSGF